MTQHNDPDPNQSSSLEPEPVVQPKSPMRQRIDAKIEELEGERREAQAAVSRAEDKVIEAKQNVAKIDSDMDKVTKLLLLVDDPEMEEVLSMVIGPAKRTAKKADKADSPIRPVVKKKEWECPTCGLVGKGNPANLRRHMASAHPSSETITAAHPQRVSDHVQVTRQLVLACTQTFDAGEEFTTRAVIDRMINGAKLTPSEESRVAYLVTNWMKALHQSGEITQVKTAQGRRPASWNKVDLTHIGSSRREVKNA